MSNVTQSVRAQLHELPTHIPVGYKTGSEVIELDRVKVSNLHLAGMLIGRQAWMQVNVSPCFCTFG
jgi:hypothetical protein